MRHRTRAAARRHRPRNKQHRDLQAINFWLVDYENANTREKYRTEAERLLLWSIFSKGKPLSSLDINDAREYVNRFLVDPQPAAQWVSARAIPRGEPGWRSFRGPLSIKSRQDALAAASHLRIARGRERHES